MSKLKQALNQIGFFEKDFSEVEKRNAIIRQTNELKSKQKRIETIVKLYNPENVEQLREIYRAYSKKIKELSL